MENQNNTEQIGNNDSSANVAKRLKQRLQKLRSEKLNEVKEEQQPAKEKTCEEDEPPMKKKRVFQNMKPWMVKGSEAAKKRMQELRQLKLSKKNKSLSNVEP